MVILLTVVLNISKAPFFPVQKENGKNGYKHRIGTRHAHREG